MIQLEEERELRFKITEKILQELSKSLRKGNLRILGVPEAGEREVSRVYLKK